MVLIFFLIKRFDSDPEQETRTDPDLSVALSWAKYIRACVSQTEKRDEQRRCCCDRDVYFPGRVARVRGDGNPRFLGHYLSRENISFQPRESSCASKLGAAISSSALTSAGHTYVRAHVRVCVCVSVRALATASAYPPAGCGVHGEGTIIHRILEKGVVGPRTRASWPLLQTAIPVSPFDLSAR
jgi:hypothetical protein